MEEMEGFIASWQDCPMRRTFLKFKSFLESKKGVYITFHPRPGISYSLRAKHPGQRKRQLFVMIDVIDDDPSNRWLSVCFYGDMITDPEERGNLIPGGLQGEDGYCFDIEEWDAQYLRYIKERIEEAYKNAAKN